MIVKIFTLKKGLELIEDVIAIRIKSEETNLLILKDYISLLGKINGDLEIETSDNTITFNNIKANFMNDNNTFSVIIDDEYHDLLFFWNKWFSNIFLFVSSIYSYLNNIFLFKQKKN